MSVWIWAVTSWSIKFQARNLNSQAPGLFYFHDDNLVYLQKVKQVTECFKQECETLRHVKEHLQNHPLRGTKEAFWIERYYSRIFHWNFPALGLIFAASHQLTKIDLFKIYYFYEILASLVLFWAIFSLAKLFSSSYLVAALATSLVALDFFQLKGLHDMSPWTFSLTLFLVGLVSIIRAQRIHPFNSMLFSILPWIHTYAVVFLPIWVFFQIRYQKTRSIKNILNWLPYVSLILFVFAYTQIESPLFRIPRHPVVLSFSWHWALENLEKTSIALLGNALSPWFFPIFHLVAIFGIFKIPPKNRAEFYTLFIYMFLLLLQAVFISNQERYLEPSGRLIPLLAIFIYIASATALSAWLRYLLGEVRRRRFVASALIFATLFFALFELKSWSITHSFFYEIAHNYKTSNLAVWDQGFYKKLELVTQPNEPIIVEHEYDLLGLLYWGSYKHALYLAGSSQMRPYVRIASYPQIELDHFPEASIPIGDGGHVTISSKHSFRGKTTEMRILMENISSLATNVYWRKLEDGTSGSSLVMPGEHWVTLGNNASGEHELSCKDGCDTLRFRGLKIGNQPTRWPIDGLTQIKFKGFGGDLIKVDFDLSIRLGLPPSHFQILADSPSSVAVRVLDSD